MPSKIVIIDDLQSNLMYLQAVLETQNYELFTAENVEEGYTLIKKHKPDIILLDVMMPDKNGIDFCSYLKNEQATKDIPVIFISADKNIASKIKGFEAGGVDYITKPFEKEDVKIRVATHLKISRLQNEVLRQNLELKQSKQKTEAILNTTPVGICLIENHLLKEANKKFYKIMGEDDEATTIKFLENINKNKKKTDKHQFETKWINSKNEQLDLQVNYANFPSGDKVSETVFSITDLTELYKNKQDLQLFEKQFKELIEIINQPAFVIDETGNIVLWNKSMQNLVGTKDIDIKNKEILFDRIENNNKKNAISKIEEALAGKNLTNFELKIQNTENQTVVLLLNSTSRKNSETQKKETMFIGQDITYMDKYRKMLENEVKKRTAELENALAHEKELNEMKSKFVSVASHEFRTPLTAISFSANFIRKYWAKMPPEVRSKKFEKIEEHVKLMTAILDDVLIYGKTESRNITINKESVNLEKFLNNIFDAIKIKKYNSHKFVLDGDIKNCYLFIDKKLGHKIFNNLLTNAVKFSPESKKIDVSVTTQNEYCKIIIQDYGIGIDEGDLKNIYTPFARGANAENIQGTGLGLAIVKESVDLLKGKIKVTSEIGKGTCFEVSLPRR